MSTWEGVREHEYEPIRGLPGRLPEGETLVWQGAPDWRGLARRAFHVRGLTVYFLVLLLWLGLTSLRDGSGPMALLRAGGLAAVAVGLVGLFAWLVGRTTVYTITDRRVVLRFGIAFPLTLNLPFGHIESAGLRAHAEGTGDILLRLRDEQKIGYLVLWPHLRPFRFGRVQPMLRAVPQAAKVAQMLGRAAAATMPAQLGSIARPEAAGADADHRQPVAA